MLLLLPSVIDPESGCIRPAISERRVDLPHPDGPTIAINSPFSIVMLTSVTAGVSPFNVWYEYDIWSIFNAVLQP